LQRNRFNSKDFVLIIVAMISLVCYFLFIPSFHPDRFIDQRISKEEALQRATDYINRSGYSTDQLRSTVRLQRDANIINQIQENYGRSVFTDQQLPKSLQVLRPYYYDVTFTGTRASDVSIDQSENPSSDATRITVHISSDGNLVSLRAQNASTVPVRQAIRSLGNGVIPEGKTALYPTGIADSTFIKALGFDINTFRVGARSDTSREAIANPEWTLVDGLNYDLKRFEVIRIAEYHLKNTLWEGRNLKADTVFAVSNSHARVRFSVPDAPPEWQLGLEVSIYPYGALNEINSTVRYKDPAQTLVSAQIVQVVSLVVFVIFFISLLIVMIKRLDARLIDLKFALTDAIVAAIFADTVLLLRFLLSAGANEAGFTPDLLALVPILIAAGAGAAILTFVLSGAGESLARISQFDELKTLELLKRGFFYNKIVGLALIRGISAGIAVVGLALIPMLVLPEAYMQFDADDRIFNVDRAVLPALETIGYAGFFSIVFSYSLFLGLGSFAWNIRKNWILVSIFIISGGTLLEILPFQIAPISSSWIIGILGMGIFMILYRLYGFATVLIGMFIFFMMWDGISGWLIYKSPDLTVSVILGIVILSLFSFGVAAVSAGQELSEIPEYIPSYVAELSSRERIERELEIARTVQLNFLPASTPNVPHFDIAAQCRPAFDTGGDFYDFIPLSDGRLVIIIGDVSGKGIQAAFYMTLMKGMIQSLSGRIDDPSAILAEINHLFLKNSEKGTFVTMIYGVLDPQSGEFAFARAGHNPLIMKPSKESHARHIPSSGIGIGLVFDERFHENIQTTRITIPENGYLYLYTDGITEAMNLKREMFGDHRLLGLLNEVQEESAERIVSSISGEVDRFVGRAAQHDDMTMVIVRRSGPFPYNNV
jgi:phosphoserine phosphatase RsbU/P